ncbi:MAG: S1 RNA-binding domain-containing protein [Myxococcaceae bacterium]|nr:S1 RNA-binding domain-containing protein [Myxococcaceae bacterium]MBH2005845.1 S1 RNA-binding domain-containing protein [Myxococcaceae bacterium]
MESQNAPIWNAIHTAEVTHTAEHGLHVKMGEVEAFLPKEELEQFQGMLSSTVRVYLENPKRPSVSLLKAEELSEIECIEAAMQKNEPIQGMIVAPIKGGFSIALLAKSREEAERGVGLRAFLPFSHVGLDPKMLPEMNDREPYWFKVKDFKPTEGNIIVSRRSLLQKERREHQKAFWESTQVGDVVSGTVKSLVAYGAFVELEGADALLHVSDMSYEQHPTQKERVQVGQELQVKVLEIDKKAKKIKVGLKQLKKDPWQEIEDEYKIGMDVSGTVVALSDFGVFLHIAEGLEGLVHSSEISWQRVKHPSSCFKIGDEVRARILRLDQEGHRISLSIKALLENPVEKLAEKYPVSTIVKAKIVGIKEYGLFVQIDEGVTALVHIGEISWTRSVEHPSELFKEGDEVDVAVLGFDSKRQRVSCSIKRTKDDPWISWKSKYAKGSRHEVTVKRVSHAGFECELEPELVAFCSTREMGDTPVKQGQTLQVEVIACDPVQHKVSMSVKARIEKEAREDYDAYLKRSEGQSSKATLGDLFRKL